MFRDIIMIPTFEILVSGHVTSSGIQLLIFSIGFYIFQSKKSSICMNVYLTCDIFNTLFIDIISIILFSFYSKKIYIF